MSLHTTVVWKVLLFTMPLQMTTSLMPSGMGRRVVLGMPLVMVPSTAFAEKRWISGKNPDGPSKDTKGTKKDFGYLQCVSGCLSVCEKPAVGKAEKARSECLNECRDQCCTTYEQCTYKIS